MEYTQANMGSLNYSNFSCRVIKKKMCNDNNSNINIIMPMWVLFYVIMPLRYFIWSNSNISLELFTFRVYDTLFIFYIY